MSMVRFSTPQSIEPLESRIAPASLTFVDVDGDQVTITTSKGSDADLAAAASVVGNVLQLLDLSGNSVFKGTDLSIEVTTTAGDGSVNIGYIDATGLDLGDVSVDGDLGQIDAGNNNLSSPAIKSLQVGSLAAQGVLTQGAGGSIISNINGSITAVTVNGNLQGSLILTGGSDGKIGTLTITGILLGGDQVESGYIEASGAIKTATLGGIQGGLAAESGRMVAKSFDVVTVNGSVVGGDGEKSGSIRAERNIAELTVTGDVLGGSAATANGSGQIRARFSILLATIEGEIRGGGGSNSGAVDAGDSLEVVTVGGGLFGGSGFESGTLGSVGRVESVTINTGMEGGIGDKSGAILATAKLNEITINGDLVGGNGKQSGVIATDGTIKQVTVNGAIIGGIGEESGAIGSEKSIKNVLVTQNVQGGEGPRAGAILSSGTIGSVTINGSIVGGPNTESGAIGAVGKIESVTIVNSIFGGEGTRSGAILSGTALASVQINGTVQGGYGFESGSVRSAGKIDFVSVDQVQGGSNSDSGQIFAVKTIKEVVVEGNVTSGSGFQSGSIVATDKISSATVRGNLEGGRSFAEGSSASLGGSIVATRLGNILVEGSVFGGTAFQSGVILARLVTTEGSSARVETPEAHIDTVVVRGNVVGDNGFYSGCIISEGTMNSITIGSESGPIEESPRGGTSRLGSLIGGSGGFGGSIHSHSDISSVTVVQDVRGHSGDDASIGSGLITSGGNVKSIEIGGTLRGGFGFYGTSFPGFDAAANEFEALAGPRGNSSSGDGKGQITVTGNLGSISIGESIFGGSGVFSAQIRAGSIGSANVANDIIAGNGEGSASIIAYGTDIKSVTVGGFMSTFTQNESLGGFASASISAARNLGTVDIGSVFGDVEGRVHITAGGTLEAGTDKQALAIKSVTIRDFFEHGRILAGYNIELSPVNPDVQIGTVEVGQANSENSVVWRFSDVVAGAESQFNDRFGDSDDRLIGGSSGTSVIAKIASVIINGEVETFNVAARGFFGASGIVAEHVVSVELEGSNISLSNGPRNDTFVLVGPSNTTLVVSEVGPTSSGSD
jgi:hypothetical protein